MQKMNEVYEALKTQLQDNETHAQVQRPYWLQTSVEVSLVSDLFMLLANNQSIAFHEHSWCHNNFGAWTFFECFLPVFFSPLNQSLFSVGFQLTNLERKWQHHEQNNFVMKECILVFWLDTIKFHYRTESVGWCLSFTPQAEWICGMYTLQDWQW